MNHKILLIDSGVTVQKIVALSLDKTKYAGLFVATKEEAKKQILDQKPELVLVSDRASGIEWQRFPKEVEAWLGRSGQLPAMVLLASGDVKEAKHYQGVLQKPFTPQALQDLLDTLINKERSAEPFGSGSFKEQSDRLNQIFREAEEEEATDYGVIEEVRSPLESKQSPMVKAREQLESLWEAAPTPKFEPEMKPQAESVSDLWGGGGAIPAVQEEPMDNASQIKEDEPQILRAEDSLAYKSLLENQVQQQLESQNLNEMVEKVLARLLPPLVERLVQERLDQLMAEQEEESDPNRNLQL